MMSKKETLVSEYERVPTKEKLENESVEPPAEYGRGVRHTQVAIMFMALSINFVARGHLGVTIVAMTNAPESSTNALVNRSLGFADINDTYVGINNSLHELENITSQAASVNETTQDDNPWNVYRTYDWNKSIQEMALGGFFLGYCIMMFPIGMVCQRFGGKIPLQIALFLNGFISIATPWLAVWGGWKAVSACRILQGMTQAGCFPSLHTLLAVWAPLSERARLTSYAFSGATFGTVLAFQISGLLSASSWGWPSIFWLSGGLCLIMFVILTIFGTATPLEHKTISEDEKNYILGRIGDGKKKVHRTPWKAILTSKHAWAAFVGQVGSGVSFVFFFTQVPSYLHYILHVNLKNNGLLSSLPYSVSIFSGIGAGQLSDFCTNRKIMTTLTARRVFNTIAQVGTAICFVTVSYTQDTTTAVIILILVLSMHAFMFTGWMINYIDLAPHFSGSLMAAGNTLGNIVTIAVPPIEAFIVSDMSDQSQWRTMFFIIGGLCIFTNTVFVALVSTETQWWNEVDNTENNDMEKSELQNMKSEIKPEKSL